MYMCICMFVYVYSSNHNYYFRSAKQVIDKAIDYATKHRYFEGMATNGFLEYYEKLLSSDTKSMTEW